MAKYHMKKLIDKIGNFQTNMTHLWHREEPEFDAEDLSIPPPPPSLWGFHGETSFLYKIQSLDEL